MKRSLQYGDVPMALDFLHEIRTRSLLFGSTFPPSTRSVMTHEIVSSEQFDSFVLKSRFAVAYFWADWAQPCKQMDGVFSQLSQEHSDVVFLRVRTELDWDWDPSWL
jgi:thiol-disulfide isomerase/thioredoxin